jgi:NAD(P)H-hydrate repair Nnr-like enzyme with NAD(P)H-hydrate dehydratase domain
MLGVYLHGAAADAYARDHAASSLIASDLPRYFSDAILSMYEEK